MEDKLKKTLFAVISEHLKTGSPVASEIISKKCGASSSSVRNRMAHLEKDGYLKNIHTSSGRVPAAKAFRFYVNELLEVHEDIFRKKEGLEKEYNAAVENCNKCLLELAELFFYLSNNLEYKVVPQPGRAVFKEIRIVLTDRSTVSGVIFASSGPAKSFTLKIKEGINQKFLDGVSELANRSLKNIALGDISENIGRYLEKACAVGQSEADFLAEHKADLFNFERNVESPHTDSASNLNKTLDAVSDFIGKADIKQNEKK